MAQSKNKQPKKAPKTRKASASRSKASVPTCGYPGTTGKPCGQTILTENGRCTRHASKPGAPKGNQNGVGHGAPLGNQNARKHGLFSASLGPGGQDALEQAKEMTPDALAREAANFALAKVAEVFGGSPEIKGLVARIDDFLDDLVSDEEITFEAKAFIMRRLAEPDIASLGKALSPIKGLLEVKKAKATDEGSNALSSLADVVARSQARRDGQAIAEQGEVEQEG